MRRAASMTLFFGMLFGAIGGGYVVYAKRTYQASFALAGVALILFPYFISNAWGTLLMGAFLLAAPIVYGRYAA